MSHACSRNVKSSSELRTIALNRVGSVTGPMKNGSLLVVVLAATMCTALACPSEGQQSSPNGIGASAPVDEYIRDVVDEDLIRVSRGESPLRSLLLEGGGGISSKTLIEALASRSVRSLTLRNVRLEDSSISKRGVSVCKTLSSLRIEHARHAGEALAVLLDAAPNLRHLWIAGTLDGDGIQDKLRRCSLLRECTFDVDSGLDECLSAVLPSPVLESLAFRAEGSIRISDFLPSHQHATCAVLRLWSTRGLWLQDTDLARTMPKLREVRFENLDLLSSAVHLSELTRLERLTLNSCRFRTDQIGRGGRWERLNYLELLGHATDGCDLVRMFSDMRGLRELVLSGSTLTLCAAPVRLPRSLDKLVLDAPSNGVGPNLITPLVASEIASLPRLTSLSLVGPWRVAPGVIAHVLRGCRLTDLDFSYCAALTDEHVDILTGSNRIRTLRLPGCRGLTDAALLSIGRCASIVRLEVGLSTTRVYRPADSQWLEVRGSSPFSAGAIEDLRSARPDIEVVGR